MCGHRRRIAEPHGAGNVPASHYARGLGVFRKIVAERLPATGMSILTYAPSNAVW